MCGMSLLFLFRPDPYHPKMTLSDWKAQQRFFTYNGHQIAYWMAGEGPPLLLLHGFPTASWDWHKIWPDLTARFRVIAADMIGFGFSDKPKRYAYAIMHQADLHEALLAELGVTNPHVLAHDYGDTVAQELLARVVAGSWALQSVCFTNGGMFPEAHQPRLIQHLLMSPLGCFLPPFLGKNNLRRNFHAIFGPETPPTDTEIEAFWTLIAHNDGPSVIPRLIHYMAERREHRTRWVTALQQTTVPLRLINGVLDPISGQQMVDRYRELVEDADVVELKTIGHYPQIEAPEALLAAYLDFVTP